MNLRELGSQYLWSNRSEAIMVAILFALLIGAAIMVFNMIRALRAGLQSFSFSKKVAIRYLWSKRSEAFITIITIISIAGVAVGVMVLNIVMAVMTGFETELRDRIIGTNSHIVIRKFGSTMGDWENVVRQIRGIDGVKTVSAFTYNQALLRTTGNSIGILIRGFEEGGDGEQQLAKFVSDPRVIRDLFNPPSIDITDAEGRPDTTVLPALVVGRELAQSMGLTAGTPVSLLSPNVSSSPFGLMPKFKRFVVVGSYQSGLVEYESSLAYMSLREAQQFFGMGNSVSGVEVRVHNIFDSPKISQAILEKLGGFSSGYYAQDWTETNKPLWDAIKLEKRAYFVVLLLIIVMASFSIISTLVMIVLEKRRDIAVMKTLGATTASVANIFRLQGAVIGILGTGLGLLLGYLGCIALQRFGFPLPEKVFPMATLPVRIEFINFFAVGMAAFLICCFATVYPARRASKLDPIDVLRYE